jgi:1,4-dihydroxy-2-naphthoate octaprenyltransferase
MYGLVVAAVAARWVPLTALLALLTLPLALRAMSIALRRSDDAPAMVRALGANVGVVLGTNLLLATAYLLAGWLGA